MGTKVLVVDDEPAVCELIQAILASAGIQADILTDSSEAAARLQREKFDAVFLDVGMPPPDGIELARKMRAPGLNQKTPIVMITGGRDAVALTKAFHAGANFFLFKPIDRRRLLRVVSASQFSIDREKRRFQRIPIRLKVLLEANEGRVEGTTLDLSLGGLLVRAGQLFPLDTQADVTLSLGAQGQIVQVKVRGRVVRTVEPDCMGIQFDNMGRADSDRLQEFLLPLILALTGQ